jgi:DNA polymerase-3 subunit delta'
MAWSDIIGQQRVKDYLTHVLRARRVAHAYLFVGPEGTGKDAVALELAKVIHCERGGEEACDACSSCLRVRTLNHPDIHFVTALPRGKDEGNDDGPLDKLLEGELRVIQQELRAKGENPYARITIPKANVIKVNSIREVRREASMTTSDRRQRVTILSQAELMNDEAANMLLKTLEEPAGHTMLILTTSKREQLLPTIQSRCQLLRFDPIPEEDLRHALAERRKVQSHQALLTARLAGGSYTRALELLSEDLLQARRDVVQFIRLALSGSILGAFDEVDRIAELKEKGIYRRFLLLLLMWCRDAMVLASGGSVLNEDQQEDLHKFVARFPGADLPRVLAGIERALTLLDRNIHPKLLLFNLILLLRTAVPVDAPMGHPGALVPLENS